MNLVVEEIYQNILSELEFIFIDIDGCKIPFKVENIKVGHNILLQLEDIDQPEKTNLFKTKSVYIEQDMLNHVAVNKETINLTNCKDFKVLDGDGKYRGTIDKINDSNGNIFANIIFENADFLIPLHKDLLIEFDLINQTIQLDYPFEE